MEELRRLKPESQEEVERVEARRLAAEEQELWPQLAKEWSERCGAAAADGWWSIRRLLRTSESTKGGC